ncbi:hypothetical protein J6590_032919 [Homalodisca vitripennis]|nr:hypothetical protein J6590_032919 [Homalodisca vitripennis]
MPIADRGVYLWGIQQIYACKFVTASMYSTVFISECFQSRNQYDLDADVINGRPAFASRIMRISTPHFMYQHHMLVVADIVKTPGDVLAISLGRLST